MVDPWLINANRSHLLIMKFCKSLRMGLATMLSAWVLLLSAARVSPGLHNFLHKHADKDCEGHCHADHSPSDSEDPSHPEHVCAVTLFASGIDCQTPVISPQASFLPLGLLDFPEAESPPFVHWSDTRARAPPVV